MGQAKPNWQQLLQFVKEGVKEECDFLTCKMAWNSGRHFDTDLLLYLLGRLREKNCKFKNSLGNLVRLYLKIKRRLRIQLRDTMSSSHAWDPGFHLWGVVGKPGPVFMPMVSVLRLLTQEDYVSSTLAWTVHLALFQKQNNNSDVKLMLQPQNFSDKGKGILSGPVKWFTG